MAQHLRNFGVDRGNPAVLLASACERSRLIDRFNEVVGIAGAGLARLQDDFIKGDMSPQDLDS